jgi:hypothetical protein
VGSGTEHPAETPAKGRATPVGPRQFTDADGNPRAAVTGTGMLLIAPPISSTTTTGRATAAETTPLTTRHR